MSLGCSDGQENKWILRGNSDDIASPPGFIWISSSPPPPFSSLAFVLCLARGRAYLMHVSVDPPTTTSPTCPPPLPPHAIALSLFGLYLLPFLCTLPLSCLILHSSVLNALPLSTLEPERSSLLRRRRGIWIRSNICGPGALPQPRVIRIAEWGRLTCSSGHSEWNRDRFLEIRSWLSAMTGFKQDVEQTLVVILGTEAIKC